MMSDKQVIIGGIRIWKKKVNMIGCLKKTRKTKNIRYIVYAVELNGYLMNILQNAFVVVYIYIQSIRKKAYCLSLINNKRRDI